MPILTQIELHFDGTYTSDERKTFLFKSRCICNYLERELLKIGFETALRRINIMCSRDLIEPQVSKYEHEPILGVDISYNIPPVIDMEESVLQGHYATIIVEGLRVAEGFMELPLNECVSALREFELGGFKNEWVQAKKSWSRVAMRSEVLASLTMYEFVLVQLIYFGDDLVSTIEVAVTKPREGLFYKYLGSLSMDRSGNINYKAKGESITTYDVGMRRWVRRGPGRQNLHLGYDLPKPSSKQCDPNEGK